MSYWIDARRLYEQVPMSRTSRLPDEGFGERPIILKDGRPPFMVYCTPKGTGPQRGPHRVKVVCTCGRHIPFGRMYQHFRGSAHGSKDQTFHKGAYGG